MPVLQRARDQPSRSVDVLNDVLVALALRLRAIGMHQEVTVLDCTVVINQASSRDPPQALVHGAGKGSLDKNELVPHSIILNHELDKITRPSSLVVCELTSIPIPTH